METRDIHSADYCNCSGSGKRILILYKIFLFGVEVSLEKKQKTWAYFSEAKNKRTSLSCDNCRSCTRTQCYIGARLRLSYHNDTAVALCDGATGQGQQSKVCKQWIFGNDVKCKKSDLACWCKSEHGSYFSVFRLQWLLLSDKAYPILGFRAPVSLPTGC